MKKVSIIGAGGMAGHMISCYLAKTGGYKIQNVSHSVKLSPDWILADVEDRGQIVAALEQFSPDIVINCAGILVKESELNPGTAAYVNGYFPHFLAKIGARNGFKLIHLSTDCVFSGVTGGYSENDPRDGKGFYAQSKAMGEVVNNRDLTVRTSIIGPELKPNGTGLFHWIMFSHGVVKGYDRAYWNGVTTLELAKAIEAFIVSGTVGLCHLATTGSTSKLNLLKLILEVWDREDPELVKDGSVVCDKTLVSTRQDLPYKPSDYRKQLEEMREWICAHKTMYSPKYCA